MRNFFKQLFHYSLQSENMNSENMNSENMNSISFSEFPET